MPDDDTVDPVDTLNFLTPQLCFEIVDDFGTPCYVYDLETLKKNATDCLAFPNAYGITVRYAMKSSPNAAILKIFHGMGLHFDCSSVHEVRRALAAGILPEKCSLSSQELSDGFEELVALGTKINCCSLLQLEKFCNKCPGKEVGLRFNPGIGSGGTSKTNVGGPSSSFGIWYEYADMADEIANAAACPVVRIHTHIGSGSDPAVWRKTSGMSISLCEKFPEVHTLNLGGGYKVARMRSDTGTNLQKDCSVVKEVFEEFAARFGRKLHLEIEPGTYLSANAGSLVCLVHDVVQTGTSQGHTFIKLNAGMTDVLRPSLYGAQHPQIVVPRTPTEETAHYVVTGHCCESGDLLTPAPDEPETIAERRLTKALPNDVFVIEACGAYCSSMSTKNYNSFPEAAELMIVDRKVHVIRKVQPVEDIWKNEVDLPDSCF